MAAGGGALPDPCAFIGDDVSELLVGSAEARSASASTTSAPSRRMLVFIAPALLFVGVATSALLQCAHHYSGHQASAAKAAARHPVAAEAIELDAASTEAVGGLVRLEDFLDQVTVRAELLERQQIAVLSPAAARGLQGDVDEGLGAYVNQSSITQYGALNETKLLQATCVIDVLYIVACLGYAIDSLYAASASMTGSTCGPSSSAQGCAVELTSAISSLSWVAFGISAATVDCPQLVNKEAVCAADIIGMFADVTGIASAATDVGSSCGAAAKANKSAAGRQSRVSELVAASLEKEELGPPPEEANSGRRLNSERHGYMRRLVSAANKLSEEDLLAIKRSADTQAGFSAAGCSFDVIMAGALLMQMGTTIARATQDCPDPRACAVDMMSIVGCVSWTVTSFASAASDCEPTLVGNMDAYCAADVTNIFAQLNFLAAYATAVGEDCNFTSAANDSTAPFLGISPNESL